MGVVSHQSCFPALLVVCAVAAVGVAYGAGGNQNGTAVDLVITTHSPACTALYLNYTDITRLTDVRRGNTCSGCTYTQDELWFGVNITAVIWAGNSNVTVPALLERPEVSSVATYSRVAPNSTETPALLALARDPNAAFKVGDRLYSVDGDLLVPTNDTFVVVDWGRRVQCGAADNFIPMAMDAVGWDGAEPGTRPAGPQPGSAAAVTAAAVAAAVAAAAAAEPAPLTLDIVNVTHIDQAGRVFVGDLMAVSVGTTNTTAVWAYMKENGALVDAVGQVRVHGYVPMSLLGPLSMRDDVFNVRISSAPILEHYGATATEGLLDHNHPNVEQWHGLGYNGTGVKVGIIDGLFNLVTTTNATDPDLPQPANITCYLYRNE